jgi:hypothetical protein
VAGKRADLKKLSEDEKRRASQQQIAHFQSTSRSLWYQLPAPEVLAASIWLAFGLSDRMGLAAIGDVKKEATSPRRPPGG